MLTRWPLCRRSLLGRIFESNDISHSAVESARRACDRRRGWARACEALARGFARCAFVVLFVRRRPARKSPVHALLVTHV
jgi:hypothetical protein